MNHIRKVKNKNYTIILIDAEKVSDKIQHLFTIKNSKKSGHGGKICQHNKGYR